MCVAKWCPEDLDTARCVLVHQYKPPNKTSTPLVPRVCSPHPGSQACKELWGFAQASPSMGPPLPPSHRRGGAGSLPHLLADELRGHWAKGRDAAMETNTRSKTQQGCPSSPETSPFSRGSSPACSGVSTASSLGIPVGRERTNLSCCHLLHASV